MPLERVADAATRLRAVDAVNRLELRRAVAAAAAAGIPATRIATAAGVDRNTIARWTREESR